MIVILKRKTLVCRGSWSKKSSKLFSLSPQFLSSICFLNWFLKQISILHQTVSFMMDIQKRGSSHSACTHGIHSPAPKRRQSIPCQSRDKKGKMKKKRKEKGKMMQFTARLEPLRQGFELVSLLVLKLLNWFLNGFQLWNCAHCFL